MMLPQELIRVRRRKGIIRPSYASKDHLSLAKTLVSVHEEHVGRTRMELDKALGGCEELGFEYKLVRGFSAVLEEHCAFKSRAAVDPILARRAVFEEAAKSVVATEDDRRRVLTAVAFRMGVSAEDLDRSLYADLYDEQELCEFRATQPSDMLKEYNFALTLALLAHAKRLEVTYKGGDEELTELGYKLGACSVSGSGKALKMTVEWRPTRRIGYKAPHLENLLSRLTTKEDWSLAAEVVYPINSKKAYRLEINDGLEGKLIKPFLREKEPEVRSRPRAHIFNLPKGDIVDVQGTAFKLGVTEAEVKELLKENGREYIVVGGIFITRAKKVEIEEALANASDMRYKAVRGILRSLGCRSPLPVLEALGYDMEWNRDRDESIVYKIGRRERS